MAFKRRRKTISNYADSESLFRDRRNRKVQGLLSHQSDILRRYHQEAFDAPNIALELPTGSGKTLVGLLIAEFHRVTKNERVLYLSPTKQLVKQVCEQSERYYGITATPFVGKIRDYDSGDKAKYQMGKTIAVAPYSALFNTNPFFDNPQLIILDDAHASENYIASNWSMDIRLSDHRQLYMGILDILRDHLPITQYHRFSSSEVGQRANDLIEKIPSPALQGKISELSALIDEHTKDTNLKYPWFLLRDHLTACHLYINSDAILIRPYIPPSLTHLPFANAKQRVFMSATLGLGGDLERTTGIPEFKRLPIPEGWDKQGIGRRYFIFPEISLSADQIDSLAKSMVEQAGRALVLVPSNTHADKYRTLFDDLKVFNARDIENTKDSFVSQEKAIAVLANRYDGIDLHGDFCRLLIIDGLPKAGNLQEVFLMSRMAAGQLFNDRIRTRIIQSFGRCTRSATDYAAVMIIGENFYDWLISNEKRSLFHPELQGELVFGSEQSAEMDVNEFLENLAIFLEHGSVWDDVDEDIREIRDQAEQIQIPGKDKLFAAAKLEVNYQYEMWDCNYEKALDTAERVSSKLTGNELAGLRGFWYYLAGSAAQNAAYQLDKPFLSNKAIELYKRASSCIPAVGWLRVIANQNRQSRTETDELNHHNVDSNIERIELLFENRSYALPHKFEHDAKDILDGIYSSDADLFENAHRRLGEMLGFESDNSSGHATPDPWWISNGDLCLVSEDKSDSNPSHSVPVKHTRQAASHKNWIRDNVPINDDCKIYTVMITTATKIHKDVPTFADDVGYWHIDEFRQWAQKAIQTIREIRATFPGPGQITWRESVRDLLLRKSLDPNSIVEMAVKTKLSDIEIE